MIFLTGCLISAAEHGGRKGGDMKRRKRLIAVVLLVAIVMAIAAPAGARTIKNNKLTIRVGTVGKLSVKINGWVKRAKWKSSNKQVVSVVRNTGVITALKPGKAVLTGKYNGGKYRVKITVVP